MENFAFAHSTHVHDRWFKIESNRLLPMITMTLTTSRGLVRCQILISYSYFLHISMWDGAEEASQILQQAFATNESAPLLQSPCYCSPLLPCLLADIRPGTHILSLLSKILAKRIADLAHAIRCHDGQNIAAKQNATTHCRETRRTCHTSRHAHGEIAV
jgi:hypothetical protein